MSGITPSTSLTLPTSPNKITISFSNEPTSPVSPPPNIFNLSFSEDVNSLNQKLDALTLKFLLLSNKVDQLALQITKQNEKVEFVYNYITQHPGDYFYFCCKCQKNRSIFLEKQIKRVQSGPSLLFNLYCPRCKEECQFGPNKDINVVIAQAKQNRILNRIPT